MKATIARVALGIAVAAFGLTSEARADTSSTSDDTRTHFDAGVRLLQDPGGARYEEAYREFKRAYEAEHNPKVLGNLALCAMMLEHDEEALDAYEKYLAAVPDLPPQETRQIQADVATLHSGLLSISLSVSPGVEVVVTDTRVPIQGATVTNTYTLHGGGTLRVRQGHHRLELRSDGYLPTNLDVEGSGGMLVSRSVTLKKPASTKIQYHQPTQPITYALAVTGGVAAVAAGITGALAISRQSDFTRLNDGTHVAEAEQARTAGRGLNLATDVLVGAALISVGAAVVSYVLRPSVPIERQHGFGGAAAWRF